MDLVGTWRLRGGEARAVIRSKKTGKPYTARDGDEIHDLRMKVVRVADSVVLIENEKGERLRLRDLLRPARVKE